MKRFRGVILVNNGHLKLAFKCTVFMENSDGSYSAVIKISDQDYKITYYPITEKIRVEDDLNLLPTFLIEDFQSC